MMTNTITRAAALSLVAATALCGLAAPTPAAAQAEAKRRFDIAAGPLDAALFRYSEQSGIQVTADAGLTAGRTSTGVAGDFTPAEALSRLLAGTGLTFRSVGGNAVRLERERRVAPAGADGAIALGPVRVRGENLVDTPIIDIGVTEGTGSYAGSTATGNAGLALTARETPQSISTVTRTQIEDQNLTQIEDVLGKVPGITVDHIDSDRYTFTARGAALNVMIDGKPSADYWLQSSNELTMVSRVSTATLDRVEVTRGSTGLMNGNGEFGGSVNLVRKRPIAGAITPQFNLGGGSWNYWQGLADVSADLADGLRSRFVAYVETGDTHVDHYRNTQATLYGVIEGDLWKGGVLSAGVDHSLLDTRGNSHGHIPLFFDDGGIVDVPRSFNPASRQSRLEEEGTTLFSDFVQNIGKRWTLNLSASYWRAHSHIKRNGLAPFGIPVDRTTGLVNVFSAKVDGSGERESYDARLSGSFDALGQSHEVMLGINHNRTTSFDESRFYDYTTDNLYTWDSDRPFPVGGDPYHRYQTFVFRQTGLFGSVRLKPAKPLALLLGARYADYGTDYRLRAVGEPAGPPTAFSAEARIIPYVSAVLDLTDQFSAYASYTDIFAPQTARGLDEQFLPPVTGHTYEIGLKAEFFDGRFQPALSLFRRKERNLAEEIPGAIVPGTIDEQAFRAVPGATTEGFEIVVAGEPVKGWSLNGGFTRSRTEDDDGVRINPETPERTLTMSTAIAATDRLRLGGDIAWREGNRFTYAPGFVARQGDYVLVNLFARYGIARRFSVGVNVENLFDKRYRENLGTYGGYLWGAPRSVLVSLNYGRE